MKNYLQKTIFILSIIIFFNSCKEPDVNPVDSGFPLDPVQSFTVELISDHEVKLSWQKHSDATTYLITKNVVGEVVPVLIEELPKDQTEYTDEYLIVGETYQYLIQAKADLNLSSSVSDTVTPSFEEISSVTLSPANDYSSLNITWTHDCSYVSGYTIEMENSLGEVSEIATLIANPDSYSYVHSNWPMLEGSTFMVTAFSDFNSSNPKEASWDGISIISDIANESIISDPITIEIGEGHDHGSGTITYGIYTTSNDIQLDFIDYNKFTVTPINSSNIGNKDIEVHAYIGNQLIDIEDFIVHLIYGELDDGQSPENSFFPIDLSNYIPEEYVMPHVYLDGYFNMIDEDASYFNESNKEYKVSVEKFEDGVPNGSNLVIKDIDIIIQDNASNDIESTQMPLSFDLDILQVNDSPTITFVDGSSRSISEDPENQSGEPIESIDISVNISDPEYDPLNPEESDSLSCGIHSNSSEVFLSTLINEEDCSFTIQIPENEHGEAEIELFAIDDFLGSDTTFSTFTLTVESVNDIPWITGEIIDTTQFDAFESLEEDPGVQKIDLTGLTLHDVEGGDGLVFWGESDDPSKVKTEDISYSSEDNTLDISFVENAYDDVNITIYAHDGELYSQDGNIVVSFSLSPVNDNPVLEWKEDASDSLDVSISGYIADGEIKVDLLSLMTVLDVEGDDTDFIVSGGDDLFTIDYEDDMLTINLTTDDPDDPDDTGVELGDDISISITAKETETVELLESNALTLTVTVIE